MVFPYLLEWHGIEPAPKGTRRGAKEVRWRNREHVRRSIKRRPATFASSAKHLLSDELDIVEWARAAPAPASR